MSWSAQPRSLVHDDSGATLLQTCDLYTHHCAVLNDHHICPESWFRAAHKPVTTPMISLCPNCHMNVHAAIDTILAGHDVTRLPLRAIALARFAFDLATEYGLTPAPTL